MRIQGLRLGLSRRAGEVVLLTLALCIAPPRSQGQAAAEYAGMASSSGAVTSAAGRALATSSPGPKAESSSGSQAVAQDLPSEEANRRALEQQAGKDAAKLLLESVPSAALTYVRGLYVGRTPLLLIVAPGEYRIQMRGERMEFGERLVELSPRETRQLALTLAQRYPARISAFTGRASASAAEDSATSSLLSAPFMKENAPKVVATGGNTRDDEANRRTLEQQTGRDAAKLVLQSAPSGALTYVNGMFVGRAPLLLVVRPGTYKVEMRGQREEHSEQLVGLLPNETQQISLTLPVRYPSRVSVHW
jgi:PEGA domain